MNTSSDFEISTISTDNVVDSMTSTIDDTGHRMVDSVIITLYALTAMIGIVGNSIVLRVIQTNSRLMRSYTYILVANMAIANLVTAVTIGARFGFCSQAALGSQSMSMTNGSEISCLVVHLITFGSYFVSSLTMVFVAKERFKLISRPMDDESRPTTTLITIWTLSLLMTLPFGVRRSVTVWFGHNDLIGCRTLFTTQSIGSWFYVGRRLLFMAGQFYLPILVTAIYYTLVVVKMVKRGNQQKRHTVALALAPNTTAQRQLVIANATYKMTLMLAITVIVFAITFLPINVQIIIGFVHKSRSVIDS